MSNKYKAVLAGVALLTAFAFGRYSAPTSVETATTVKVDDKTKTDKQTDVDKHTETTTTETKKPDGTTETVTKTIEDTKKKTSVEKTDVTTTDTKSSTETVYSSSKITISALGGISSDLRDTVFGISFTRPVLGPITLGVWGLTSQEFGFSIGLTF